MTIDAFTLLLTALVPSLISSGLVYLVARRGQPSQIAANEATTMNTLQGVLANVLGQFGTMLIEQDRLRGQVRIQDDVIEGLKDDLAIAIDSIAEADAKAIRADARTTVVEANWLTREKELMEVNIYLRALVDGMPPRIDYLEEQLRLKGIIPPRDAGVDTARAAIQADKTLKQPLASGTVHTPLPAAELPDTIPVEGTVSGTVTLTPAKSDGEEEQ